MNQHRLLQLGASDILTTDLMDQLPAVALPQNATDNSHSLQRVHQGAASGTDSTTILYSVVGWFVLIAFCYCAKSDIPDERYRRGHLIRQAARERRRRAERIRKLTENPQLRIASIQESILLYKVTARDDDGNLTLSEEKIIKEEVVVADQQQTPNLNKNPAREEITPGVSQIPDNISGPQFPPLAVSVPDASSEHNHDAPHVTDLNADDVDDDDEFDNDNYGSTCAICLEPFRVGDVVAWSKKSSQVLEQQETQRTQQQTQQQQQADTEQLLTGEEQQGGAPPKPASTDDLCLHVFHRDCIVEWLSNPAHDDCPSCRSLIIIMDLEDEKKDTQGADPIDSGNEAEIESGNEGNETKASCCRQAGRDGIFRNGDDSDNDDDDEGSRASMAFVIMHGLISRVRRVQYALVGIDSVDSDDIQNKEDQQPNCQTPESEKNDGVANLFFASLSQPARFRRVFSLGSAGGGTRRVSAAYELTRRRSLSSSLRGCSSKRRRGSSSSNGSAGSLFSSFPSIFRSSSMSSTNRAAPSSSDIAAAAAAAAAALGKEVHFPPLNQPATLRRVVSAGPGHPIVRAPSPTTGRQNSMLRHESAIPAHVDDPFLAAMSADARDNPNEEDNKGKLILLRPPLHPHQPLAPAGPLPLRRNVTRASSLTAVQPSRRRSPPLVGLFPPPPPSPFGRSVSWSHAKRSQARHGEHDLERGDRGLLIDNRDRYYDNDDSEHTEEDELLCVPAATSSSSFNSLSMDQAIPLQRSWSSGLRARRHSGGSRMGYHGGETGRMAAFTAAPDPFASRQERHSVSANDDDEHYHHHNGSSSDPPSDEEDILDGRPRPRTSISWRDWSDDSAEVRQKLKQDKNVDMV